MTKIARASQARTAELGPYRADRLLPYVLGDQANPLAADSYMTVAARLRGRPQRRPICGLRGNDHGVGLDKRQVMADTAPPLHHPFVRYHCPRRRRVAGCRRLVL